MFCPHPPPRTHWNPGRETQLSGEEQHVSHAAGCPGAPGEGHPPSERREAPISRGMTSSGKTPLSPTRREPRREQIQVSSLSPLSRAPQDSLSLVSRRQAAAAPRFRRACWEPQAPPRSCRATAAKKRSLWPAMPQPEQGHPGMPGAEKHKVHLHEPPLLAEHRRMLRMATLSYETWHLNPPACLAQGLCGSKRWVHRAKDHSFSLRAGFRLPAVCQHVCPRLNFS